MRDLTQKEQVLYDKFILLINKYLSSKKRKEEVIEVLDSLIERIITPDIDVDAVYEYFFGGSKK